MKVEKVHGEIRYTLSNEDLKESDKVFPIAHGRCLGGDEWILHNFDFRDFMSGFPNEPHIILNLKYDASYKPYEIRTNHGYSPRECYYKIIKREKQVEVIRGSLFKSYEWVEI